MMQTLQTFAWSEDLTGWPVVATALLLLASIILLMVELRMRRNRRAWAVFASGLLSLTFLGGAILRPAKVREVSAAVGASVWLLIDGSRSMDLPEVERRERAKVALRALVKRFGDAAQTVGYFGSAKGMASSDEAVASESDLVAGLESALSQSVPQAVVVVSDGRLTRPIMASDSEQDARGWLPVPVTVPVHTVHLGDEVLADAAILNVGMPGAFVAHQHGQLNIEVACRGGLACGSLRVSARELHPQERPVALGSTTVSPGDGVAMATLDIILDRTGHRIVEISIEAPSGDSVAANNTRYVEVDVARDRVRLLHVAGRPTYDVRALRTWLKADASLDLVAFFILRTLTDNARASRSELALIPFPVDELFEEHLQSFDAVILQDFDAQPYGLAKHLGSLARYVERGGGLVMVGGPNAFVGGHYGRTPLSKVMPMSLEGIRQEDNVNEASFSPGVTQTGRHAPVMLPVLDVLDGQWPTMPGTNVVGKVRPGATVLLQHPTLTAEGQPMPILALGEYGSGRSVALTVDGSHRLLFSEEVARSGGRAHGAFWDAILGWLMRDPRFESARVVLPSACLAGVAVPLDVHAAFQPSGTRATMVIKEMSGGAEVFREPLVLSGQPAMKRVVVPKLKAGGYSVSVVVGERSGGEAGVTAHLEFACEVGGAEWADIRPDIERLKRIAVATKGVAVGYEDAATLPLPTSERVVEQRQTTPLLAQWLWSLLAAAALGGHWLLRRGDGLS